MKIHQFILVASVALASMATIHGQTFNWGSPVFSDLVDSNGDKLDSTFVFELGTFEGFTPNSGNIQDWSTYWRVFDRAVYNDGSDTNNPVSDFFAGTATMNDSGASSSPFATSPFDFGGLDAYLWVRNSDDAVPGTEWFLARADAWSFPNATPGCCDNNDIVQWSLSDLGNTNVTPTWGRSIDNQGAGIFTDDNTHSLQTYTIIPEPSSALLLTIAGLALASRRRR